MEDLTYDHMTYYKQVAATISKQEISREQLMEHSLLMEKSLFAKVT